MEIMFMDFQRAVKRRKEIGEVTMKRTRMAMRTDVTETESFIERRFETRRCTIFKLSLEYILCDIDKWRKLRMRERQIIAYVDDVVIITK